MSRRVLRIANGIAIFGSQFWIVERDSLIDCGVTVNVGRIVR